MNLLELRKYAIDRRIEIRFGSPATGRECLIDGRGVVRIPGEDKDFSIEELLDEAAEFIISSNGSAERVTREEIARMIAETSGKKAAVAHDDDDE